MESVESELYDHRSHARVERLSTEGEFVLLRDAKQYEYTRTATDPSVETLHGVSDASNLAP